MKEKTAAEQTELRSASRDFSHVTGGSKQNQMTAQYAFSVDDSHAVLCSTQPFSQVNHMILILAVLDFRTVTPQSQ